jgi:hypothetical protein
MTLLKNCLGTAIAEALHGNVCKNAASQMIRRGDDANSEPECV